MEFCFKHDGPSNSPKPGDKITIFGQFGEYDMILISVESSENEDEGFTGEFVNPDDMENIFEEIE